MQPVKKTAGDGHIDSAEIDAEISFLLCDVRTPGRQDYLDAAAQVRRAAGLVGGATQPADVDFWRRVVAELIRRANA